MHLGITFIALALSTIAYADYTVRFFNERYQGCNGWFSQEYKSANCNVCIRAPQGYPAVQVLGVTANQRVSYHSGYACGSGSQVGQWYGSQCITPGTELIQSVYIACEGFRIANNTTLIGEPAAQEVKSD